MPDPHQRAPKRVLLFGATGTIGRATAQALVGAGHDVTCVIRSASCHRANLPQEARMLACDALEASTISDMLAKERPFDAAISCLASRTGAPADAWAVDYQANVNSLGAAKDAGVQHFLLLSAICVQKPRLAFQRAKLAFEEELQNSGIDWSIVRPTAYFKSLSGQIGRVRAGKPFLVFGDGRLTSCKPISDRDLGSYMVCCLGHPDVRNRILPVGGPGPALTPLDQAEELFRLAGRPVQLRRVPVALISGIAAGLSIAGWMSHRLSDKAELARIGRFYATESMLVLNPTTGRYDAEGTPSFGTDRLFDYYAAVFRGEAEVERGDHSVF